MADEDLDSLYRVQPEAFTAERTRLTAAAKQRGDAAAAQRISTARKPTTAAWIANRLVLLQSNARQRLADLGDRLHAAHAAMDGDRIRELSAEQHKLIDELARAAFDAADIATPSSSVRDDVTSTLQAAIADPDVRARLGRLARAERWSGFGAFGDAAPVLTAAQSRKAKEAQGAQGAKGDKPTRSQPKRAEEPSVTAARQQLEKLTAASAAAERALTEADALLSERQSERDAARQRRDDARASLREAERESNDANARYEKAQRASRAAAELLKAAKAQLKRADTAKNR